jgi:hypothetical protein
MGESWLTAVQRAYDVFVNFPDQQVTITAYVFLGDPLSPFRVLPDVEIGSYVREPDSTVLKEMPDNFAVGCPGADADDIVITVSVDSSGLGGTINPSDLRLDPPGGDIVSGFGQRQVGDHDHDF